MSSSPGIFYNAQFIVPSHKNGKGKRTVHFSGFLGYQGRKEAIEKMTDGRFALFMDYQDDKKKSEGLIGMDGHYLTPEERKLRVARYDRAQIMDSVLWQDLFTFDTDWLRKHGYYDPATETFDESRIVRNILTTMELIIDREKLQKPLFTLAFHYNTQHLHCHVSMVEEKPSRPWKDCRIVDPETGEIRIEYQPIGRRESATVRDAKRHFVNEMLAYTDKLSQLDDCIRRIIVADVTRKKVLYDPVFESAILDVYQHLPPQRNNWQYGYAKRQHFKEPMDRLIRLYLQSYHLDECRALNTQLDEMDQEYYQVYRKHDEIGETLIQDNGFATGSAGSDATIPLPSSGYREHKIADLFSRTGNALLREIRSFDREMRKKGVKDPKQFLPQISLQSLHQSEEKHEKENVRRPENRLPMLAPRQHQHFDEDAEGQFKADKERQKARDPGVNGYRQGTHQEPSYSDQFRSVSQSKPRERPMPRAASAGEWRRKVTTNRLLGEMNRAFKREYDRWRDEMAYEQMEREMDAKAKFER
ncbi:MobP2 family relaxase [Sporolactobacillus sp. KGMB 08714]|uniref:MobP2 family relaxase n=1 Tax=Sporolactobacillus sp. KGMB 08714 TaxID=3064704 RepID=UPI002FBEC21D